MERKKIALIGAGNIGGELAIESARRELGNIILLDIPQKENVAKGKALDIAQTCALMGYDADIMGTSDYTEIEGAQVVIVTAGIPRRPGMSREDLLETNLRIIRSVGEKIKILAPSAFVIVISNPLDAMVYEMKEVTGFPRERIVGMAGTLDAARFQYFIAKAANVSTKDVKTLVLGGHGDTMVPCLNYCTINSIPVTQLLSKEVLDTIVQKTRYGGGEIVNLMETSAYFAPAASAMDMAESFLRNQRRIMPCAAYLEGEYGVNDLFLGVPILISNIGAEKVIEVDLNKAEKKMLNHSIQAVKDILNDVKKVKAKQTTPEI